MRIATVVGLICVAGALSGCGIGNMFASSPGHTVEFVASNPDSVLLDFGAKPPGELQAANQTATQQCQLFNSRAAVLESLTVRDKGRIRATYLCKGGAQAMATNAAATDMKHRQ
jgi:hypothetical protein